MKKLFLTLIFMFVLSSPVFAAPFMESDPQAGVTEYKVNIPSQGIVDEITVAQPDGSAHHDVGSWPAGTYSGTIQAGAEYILNGAPQEVMEWSVATPFDLTKPSASAPLNIDLKE